MNVDELLKFVPLVGAIGIGAIATKLLDIIWLQRALNKSERKKWLREQRLKTYSKLAQELLSLGKSEETRKDPFKGYSFAAEAILLTDKQKLADSLEKFFTMSHNLYFEAQRLPNDPSKKPEEELESAYEYLFKESRRLVKELRKTLHDKT